MQRSKRSIILALLGIASSSSALSFFSYRLFTGPGLQVGTDLRGANLTGPAATFPGGRQLVLVQSISFPLTTGRNQGADTAIARYRQVLTPFRANTQMIFTANGSPADRQRNGITSPTTLAQVQIPQLQGPWNSWVDAAGNLPRVAAVKSTVGGAEGWGGLSFVACTQDARITSVYQDYLLKYPQSGRLQAIAQRCTGSGVNAAQVPIPYRTGATGTFRLRAQDGTVLDSRTLRGPFALMVLPPDGAFEGLQATRTVAAAAQVLRLADVPLHVVALPNKAPGDGWADAPTVARSLAASLPGQRVFVDAQGNFIDTFSHYLGSEQILILFNRQGVPVDSFAGNAGNLPLPNTLPQALVEYGLL